MTLSRRAAKRDASEKDIVDYLRKAGWSWLAVSVPNGPDGFAAKHSITIAVECKTGTRKLRAGQQRWAESWQGLYYVLRTIEEAAALTRAMGSLKGQ